MASEDVTQAEPDLSWLDIAIRSNSPGDEMIVAHSPGWAEIGLDLPYLCDNVEHYDAPAEAGLYRWSGYTVGSWDEGELIVITGGTWTRYALAHTDASAETRLREAARAAHDTLIELNPSNYSHDDVCEANNAAVEAILLLAGVLGERHGKSEAWWAERRAALTPPAPAKPSLATEGGEDGNSAVKFTCCAVCKGEYFNAKVSDGGSYVPQCAKCGTSLYENAALASAPNVSATGEVERLGYGHMGSGGRCDWTHLREAVAEAISGSRANAKLFDPAFYPGHQMVDGINFNSLNRIVTAFVDSATRAPASAAPEQGERVPTREEIARLLCDQHGGDPDAIATDDHDTWEGPLWTVFVTDADAILALIDPAQAKGGAR